MPFERPTLTTVDQRIQADLKSRLPGTEPQLAQSLLGILARMEAGSVHGLYGGLDWLSRNLLPTTQDAAILGEWATIYNVPRLRATPASGLVAFTGTGAVPKDTALTGPNGLTYHTTQAITAPNNATVEASQPGSTGNVAQGATLTLVSPLAGVDANAVVGADGLTGGADQEGVADWSSRLLQRIRNPPQGGSMSDYERWAREAHPAVTNVWVLPTTPQPGQVTLYLMAYGSTANGIPSQTVIDAVEAHIQTVRPVAAQVFVFAPAPDVVNITVQLAPFTNAVKQAVTDALEELFEREAAPGAAIPLSHIDEAVSAAVGEYDHQLTGLTQANLTPSSGRILLLGSLTLEAMP